MAMYFGRAMASPRPLKVRGKGVFYGGDGSKGFPR